MYISMFLFCLSVSMFSNALKYRTLRHLEIAIVQMKRNDSKEKSLEKDLKRFMVTDYTFQCVEEEEMF